jgi:adenine-specific DNA-methyltransferase
MFRATDFLLRDPHANASVPLLLPHNVKPFTTVWPLGKNGKPAAIKVSAESLRLLLPTRNYVLLKRFSAKEEKRRLTAGCFLLAKHSLSHVGIENHVNYVYHADRELSEDEAYGIAGLFNSTLLDRYFRTISGSTQVNATEIRTMNFPDLRTLARIGGRIKANVTETEAIVLSELGVSASLRNHLLLT